MLKTETELSVIDEREDCAQICNDLMTEDGEKCASLIRKRGDQTPTKKEQDENWRRGRYPGKVTMHWLRVAFDRIAAGEKEFDVMCDYGYLHKSALGKHPPKYK